MRVHFIGIGGVSMSALAKLTLKNGHEVSGSDLCADIKKVEGIRYYYGHSPENVSGCALVVYTAAVARDNTELVSAKRQGIRVMERAEYLGLIEGGYSKPVAVSGTHGKTTVSAMTAACLLSRNPTVHLGGDWKEIGGNFRSGGREFFVTEACEYNRSFLSLKPYLAVINNIERDHTDCFADMKEMEDAFRAFARNCRADGIVAAFCDDERAKAAAWSSGRETVLFGTGADADFRAQKIREDGGLFSFEIAERDAATQVSLAVPGRYNVNNALAAFAIARSLGVPAAEAAAALSGFRGVDRRFEIKGTYNGAKVVADYAHHPTEITAALTAARKMTKGKLYAVFQPHTYTRTAALYGEFIDALILADGIYTAPTYAAREKPPEGFKADALAADIAKAGGKAVHCGQFYEIFSLLKDTLTEGDILMILGAGDIYKLADLFVG